MLISGILWGPEDAGRKHKKMRKISNALFVIAIYYGSINISSCHLKTLEGEIVTKTSP